MENMSYVDPKAVHIFCGSDLPVSRLESFGDLHKFASPKAASEALVEFARGQKGPCLILAEGDKVLIRPMIISYCAALVLTSFLLL